MSVSGVFTDISVLQPILQHHLERVENELRSLEETFWAPYIGKTVGRAWWKKTLSTVEQVIEWERKHRTWTDTCPYDIYLEKDWALRQHRQLLRSLRNLTKCPGATSVFISLPDNNTLQYIIKSEKKEGL